MNRILFLGGLQRSKGELKNTLSFLVSLTICGIYT